MRGRVSATLLALFLGVTGAVGAAQARSHKPRKARPAADTSPFAQRGMWIWMLPSSNHGSLPSIVATAKRYGVGTLYIKSGDGSGLWSQFSPALVQALHASGLRVCAWQYVYGIHPLSEAAVGATAVHDGADCLIIDAESEYEGKYVQAQSYIARLRQLIGQSFPVGLAGLPYIDYHPAFPYSVFLGPGGAQANLPQMYWKDIGTSVDTVYSHTYMFNRLYGRSIYPLGQTFQSPSLGQLVRFRQISRAYAATNVSWWDWQETSLNGWKGISRPAGALANFSAYASVASLGRGARGDVVVWAQEHLFTAGQRIAVDGSFGPKTQAAVQRFQTAHGIVATGLIDAVTWQALLRYAPATVVWGKKGAKVASVRRASSRGAALFEPVPRSASAPDRGWEIPRSLGAGKPH